MSAGVTTVLTGAPAGVAATGLAGYWAQADSVSRTVAIVLLAMSVASWLAIAAGAVFQWRLREAIRRALEAFWQAGEPAQALAVLRARDRSGVFAGVAAAGANAARQWRAAAPGGLGGGMDAGEYVGRSLQQAILFAQARVERGLTLLASVGSTAPFVGLFGTVWGIYHALAGLAGATQVALDRVAGPVGEALIMTAAGLFVAIPAVLAYNAFARANRLVLAHLDGFGHALHADLVAGLRASRPD